MTNAPAKIRLPRVERVKLHRFSLFTANPNAEFSAADGVLCLVGANGIGKSTLLSAINYCLTGTVSEPGREFKSMDEYYKHTRRFSGSYFKGRIRGEDEAEAEIRVAFSIGKVAFELTRGLFEPDELRALSVINRTAPEPVDESPAADAPRGERHNAYADALVRHVGVASFEEFVFLQHFVFTFDEQRRTLFWNPRILERVLFRTFGVDPDMAKHGDSMRREIEAEDSKVRNRQYEATRLRVRINELLALQQSKESAHSTYESLAAEHEALTSEFDDQTRHLTDAEDAVNDALLAIADLSMREASLRRQYAEAFEERLDQRPRLERHPLVVESIAAGRCGLCGTAGLEVSKAVRANARGEACPLCQSALLAGFTERDDLPDLKVIDEALTAVRHALGGAHFAMRSLRDAEAAARDSWQATKGRLAAFDSANSATLQNLLRQLQPGSGASSLDAYRDQLAALETEKQTAYEKREILIKRLSDLKRDLETQYAAVEDSFVPLFTDLAQHFIGVPLSVQFETQGTQEARLVVSVRGTARRQQQQLSESQRFFLDIALRMALSQHMSHADALGGILIDTPEGSLDVAYEKRAGEMLAKFALSGHQIIMTANLNSSRLLLSVARECGQGHMTLCRMMDWAELSEVQKAEEGVFSDAFVAIEEAMNA